MKKKEKKQGEEEIGRTFSSKVERLYEAHKRGTQRERETRARRKGEGRGNPVARSVRGGFVREPIDDAAGS